jgi:hypothetical protein
VPTELGIKYTYDTKTSPLICHPVKRRQFADDLMATANAKFVISMCKVLVHKILISLVYTYNSKNKPLQQ